MVRNRLRRCLGTCVHVGGLDGVGALVASAAESRAARPGEGADAKAIREYGIDNRFDTYMINRIRVGVRTHQP